MIYSALRCLPLGSIRAEGFLKQQLERNRDGIGGHLDEIEPGMIADPYVHKTYVKQWGAGDQSGWGAEISGNYWTGLVLLAYTLHDEGLMKKAENWVDKVLSMQKPDGYLGTYWEEDAKIYEDYNAWGNACGMRALLFFYEATGREDVFNAVYRSMLWFCDKWKGEHKTGYAGEYITVPMMYCYKKTEDKRLLDFCLEYQAYSNRVDLTHTSKRALLHDDLYYNSEHTAGYAPKVMLPACCYAGTGDPTDLAATVRGVELLRRKAMHPTGSPVSVTEYLAPVSSTGETEYCSYAYFNTVYGVLAEVSGSAVYGDYMEEAVYNGVQGARKKDERAIAYLSAPNQCFATTESSPAVGDMQVYAPCYPVACCPVNSVVVIPEFIRDMVLTDDVGALYFAAYGPCSVEYDGKKARIEGEYPFKNELSITISGTEKAYFKKPGWAKGMHLTVDGAEVSAHANENGYVPVTCAD
ncbi:MAG: glycoside hydrolase family 127 protein, partial [Clostridia bacterium]|nr:glycoside hydrolase family 127 protein [Clostridia bacterium]